jgi:hypothetical protein
MGDQFYLKQKQKIYIHIHIYNYNYKLPGLGINTQNWVF